MVSGVRNFRNMHPLLQGQKLLEQAEGEAASLAGQDVWCFVMPAGRFFWFRVRPTAIWNSWPDASAPA